MEDVKVENDDTQVSAPTAAQPRKTLPPISAGPGPTTLPKKSGGFRRWFFVFLLLVVVIGAIVSAALLGARFSAVLGEVEDMDARLNEALTDLEQAQSDLASTQSDLDDLSQELQNLTEESARAQSELETQLRYSLLLQQAQNEVAKAIISLDQENIGQARREITALQASLLAAANLASGDDAAALDGLAERADQAEADLSDNAPASLYALEFIWRELDDLSTSLRGGE
jgi:septal ring factor EnvC (AmiA/AmiB activator)